ncbi:hypothetical protein POTOM_046657 [Populus tomentosa]|uniref:Uncharacterized protein n=1 Tax=Populus tomentosa TaxID=118781 RepID=A0A8X8CBQ2_POPTO|nr:hypothetical protein POTOM_046657 [Populus tomentosa]
MKEIGFTKIKCKAFNRLFDDSQLLGQRRGNFQENVSFIVCHETNVKEMHIQMSSSSDGLSRRRETIPLTEKELVIIKQKETSGSERRGGTGEVVAASPNSMLSPSLCHSVAGVKKLYERMKDLESWPSGYGNEKCPPQLPSTFSSSFPYAHYRLDFSAISRKKTSGLNF